MYKRFKKILIEDKNNEKQLEGNDIAISGTEAGASKVLERRLTAGCKTDKKIFAWPSLSACRLGVGELVSLAGSDTNKIQQQSPTPIPNSREVKKNANDISEAEAGCNVHWESKVANPLLSLEERVENLSMELYSYNIGITEIKEQLRTQNEKIGVLEANIRKLEKERDELKISLEKKDEELEACQTELKKTKEELQKKNERCQILERVVKKMEKTRNLGAQVRAENKQSS